VIRYAAVSDTVALAKLVATQSLMERFKAMHALEPDLLLAASSSMKLDGTLEHSEGVSLSFVFPYSGGEETIAITFAEDSAQWVVTGLGLPERH